MKKALVDIRNILSHSETKYLLARIKVESMLSDLAVLENDAKTITNAFKPAYGFQKNRVRELLLSNLDLLVKDLRPKMNDYSKVYQNALDLYNTEFIMVLLDRDITSTTNNNKFLSENLLEHFRDYLKSENFKAEDRVDKILDRFEPLSHWVKEVLRFYPFSTEASKANENFNETLERNKDKIVSPSVLSEVNKELDTFQLTLKDTFLDRNIDESYFECQTLMKFINTIKDYCYFSEEESVILKSLVRGENGQHLEAKVERMLDKLELHRKDYDEITSQLSITETLRRKIFHLLTINVEFLLSRINNLKAILIDEDENAEKYWVDDSSEMRQHAIFLMVKRYTEPGDIRTRAALEMAYFDCMNVLYHRNDLRDLWTKANSLFTGLNLRNLLAHGYREFEAISETLDPDDLPKALVLKMLELIQDGDAVRNMLELCRVSNIDNKKAMESFITSIETDKFQSIRCNILKSRRWKKYLNIMPLK